MGLTHNFHGKKAGPAFSLGSIGGGGGGHPKSFHNDFSFASGPQQVFVNGPLLLLTG